MLIVFLMAISGPAQAVPDALYRLNVGAPATTPSLQGLQVVLHTVKQTDHDLLLRLGVFNPTDKAVDASEKLAPENIALVSYSDGKRQETKPTTCTLTDICPGGSLASKTMNNGLLTFPLGSLDNPPAGLGTLTLRLAHFGLVSFRLDDSKWFAPLDYAAMEKRSPLNFDVQAQAEQLAIFTLRLRSLVIHEDALDVVLGFQNSSRFAVKWQGQLNGGMCRLITSQGDVLEPLAVSPSLAERIAPEGRTWPAGEENPGWIRFPLPEPQMAEELLVCFPGYAPIRCNYSRDLHAWQTAAKARPATATNSKVDAVLEEERNFASVKAFWTEATRELGRARFKSFLARFSGEALQDQRISIAGWSALPVTSVELSVPGFQRIRPDARGAVKDVHVQMRYTLATLPRDNIFICHMECDMRRDGEEGWTVEDIRYPKLQPFWLLGYTGVSHSDHFTIFHRPLPDARKEVDQACQQLEKSYARLLRTGLPLGPHNAAFLVASKPDFEKLTNRDPDNYSGVASAAYSYREGRVSVINKAMYLNDYRFFAPRKGWGKQDRQVVIQHEMVHLALAEITRPWTPPWLVEGVAMHYAGQCDSFSREALRRALKPAVNLPGLSGLEHLGADTDSAVHIMTEYQLAGETVRWLVKKYGEPAVLKLYASYAAETPENLMAMQGNGETARAARLKFARKVFARQWSGLSLEQLDAIVREVVNG